VPAKNSRYLAGTELQEIKSAPATQLADSSAAELLAELSRVKKHRDSFPLVATVSVFFVARLLVSIVWWQTAVAFVAALAVSVWARNNDVTNGTAVLNYSIAGSTDAAFTKVKAALQDLSRCQRLWHLDASAITTDWKRNAGAASTERRSPAGISASVPPRVQCNLETPMLSTGKKSLYFFPDRVLVYDSSGIGAVSYSTLEISAAPVRYIEDESVPTDALNVGATWRYVNRDGGPDRRFNNNRQLPILLYGQIGFKSSDGLNEVFKCSAHTASAQFASQMNSVREELKGHVGANQDFELSFASANGSENRTTTIFLSTAVLIMVALFFFLPWPNGFPGDEQIQQSQLAAEQQHQIEVRKEFASGLAGHLPFTNSNIAVSSADEILVFSFDKEGPKSALRDGVEPFDKKLFFSHFLERDSETELCGLGFRTFDVIRNNKPANIVRLDCPTTQAAGNQSPK
jgi:hypothetical protein